MPGLIGLNNIKNTDYVNVVVQSLSRVPPLRDFFLLPANYAHVKSPLVKEFGALLRKMWSPHNFKGQVSPHELLQALMYLPHISHVHISPTILPYISHVSPMYLPYISRAPAGGGT